MNVYALASPPSSTGITVRDYELKGCVTDGGNRALIGHSFTSDRMTAEACVAECSSRGFSMAGVEL